MLEPDYESIDRRLFEEVWTRCALNEVEQIYGRDFICHHPPDPDIIGCDGIHKQIQRIHLPDWIVLQEGVPQVRADTYRPLAKASAEASGSRLDDDDTAQP